MLEVEYLWNPWIKTDGANADVLQSNTIRLTLNTPTDFAFSPRFSACLYMTSMDASFCSKSNENLMRFKNLALKKRGW